ncbi:MAG: carboxypeptidase regulatory-like domain-containing protein [Planctomycetota bacterium]
MRSAPLLFAALALLSGCCSTTISGTVTTLDGNEPVSGAVVSVDGLQNAHARTNAMGRYRLRDLPCRDQAYIVRVVAAGYPELWDEVRADGAGVVKDFALGAGPAPGPRDDTPVPVRPQVEDPAPAAQPDPEPEQPAPRPRPRPHRPRPQPQPQPSAEEPAPAPAPAREGRNCPACETFTPKGTTHCPGCGARVYEQ